MFSSFRRQGSCIDCCGYFYVQSSHLIFSWKRRFFTLSNTSLSFYLDEYAFDSNKGALGRMTVCDTFRWNEINQGMILISIRGDVWKAYVEYPYAEKLFSELHHALVYRDSNSPVNERLSIEPILDKTRQSFVCSPLGGFQCEITGWMKKQNDFFFKKKWQSLYFVLVGDTISYFNMNLEGHRAKNTHRIRTADSTDRVENGIIFYLSNGKELVVQATCKSQRIEWLEYIKNKFS